MYSMTIDLFDKASPVLDKCRADLNSPGIKEAIGGGARRIFQQHFSQLDDEHGNSHGWPRTHFYAKAARSTRYEVEGDGVTVSTGKTGIMQRRFGGTIKPVNGGALTIPAIAEAYGHRAGKFPNLEMIWPKGHSVGMLVERQGSEIKIGKDRRKGREGQTRLKQGNQLGGRVFFWLVAQVTQEADPSVLPEDGLLEDAIHLAVFQYLRGKQ